MNSSKWGLEYPDLYYIHSSIGACTYDPGVNTKHFDPWWLIINVDPEIIRLYRYFLRGWGIKVVPNNLWGPHISVVKGIRPRNLSSWGLDIEIKFNYTNIVRWDNDFHAWLDVYSDDLEKILIDLGLPPTPRFHLTLGRLT
jgi:hypothetical protein